MKYKKIIAVGLGALALGALAGCTQTDPLVDPKVQSEIAKAESAAYSKGLVEGKQLVDVTSDNEKVIAEALANRYTIEQVQAKVAEQEARDAQIIADYKAELDASKAELAQLVVVPATNSGTNDKYTKDELALQSTVTVSLDDSDLSYLQDGQIEFNDEDNIDVHEELNLAGIGIKTSIADNEFDDKVFMTLPENSIVYKYVFDDAVNSSLISKDEPLNIKFLGKDLEIIDMDSTSFTTIEGEKVMMTEGEEQTLKIDGEDVKVKLLVVSDSSNKVSLSINGEVKSGISEGDVVQVGDSGFEVYVKSVMSNEAGDVSADFAELRIAKDVEKTYENGDEVIEDDSRWEYTISLNADKTINSLGVRYAEVSDSLGDDYPAVVEKEFVTLPNGFAKVGIELKHPDLNKYEFSFTEHNNQDMIKVESSDKEGIVVGTDKISKAYLNATNIVYDDDNGDEQVKALNTANLVNDDTSLALGYTAPYLTVGTKLKMHTNGTFKFMGTLEDDAEALDVVYDSVNYGTQEESLVTETGMIIKTPENNDNNDKLVIQVPAEDDKATLVVE